MKMKNLFKKLSLVAFCAAAMSFGASDSYGQIATIGNGTSSYFTGNPISIGGYGFGWNPPNTTTHHQILYTAAEINAAGVTGARMLDSIAWDVLQVPAQALKSYTIKVKTTPFGSLDNFDSIGLTTAVSLPTFLPTTTTWTWIPFSTPIFWNGVDNIIFDICSDTLKADPSGKVRTFTPTAVSNYWLQFGSPNPICGIYTPPSAPYPFQDQPNIKMGFSANAPACTGTPVVGILSPAIDTTTVCASLSQTYQITNTPQNNVTYQWQQSVNGGAWADITNANGTAYTATVSPANTYVKYRAKIICPATNLFSYSIEKVLVTAAGATYASLPYTQNFETWMSRCDSLEIPDDHWSADPVTGNGSWRREDQGGSAHWTDDVMPYFYFPYSSEGNHSARFRTSSGDSGSMMLYLDCSAPGQKIMSFDYFNKSGATTNKLEIFLSTDAGATFNSIAVYGPQGVTGAQWLPQSLPFTSTSATTILKFYGKGIAQSGDFDMGIDHLSILPSCSGTPVAGEVDSTAGCLGQGVQLSLSGETQAGGIGYLWQYSTDGISWNFLDTIASPTTALMQPTWYRSILTCSNSGLSDTTAARLVNINPFYYCYCNSASTVSSTQLNIGNVTMINESNDTLVNNGNPLPLLFNQNAKKHYTNYTNVPPANLFIDSTYNTILTYFTANGTNVNPQMGVSATKVYIDYNHNGQFDTLSELVYFEWKSADSFYTNFNFTVPSTAMTGLTGMRIVANNTYDTNSVVPCGSYGYGETEDYLVNINAQPCTGPVMAGTISASDTMSCPGYPLTLTNTGYDSLNSPYSKVWQSSINQTAWTDITGTMGQNVINPAMGSATTWYRIKAICLNTQSVSYSDTVKVALNPVCYCVSYADGGFSGMQDSSDVGSFKLGSIDIPLVGGHLNNTTATSKYTNYHNLGVVELKVDSTYTFKLDHVLLRNTHGDAKITMFIDYNANGVFDIPEERVYSEVSEATTWHKTGTITIPHDVVKGTPTGLRLIINNNTAPNAASDDACGIYTSGETEDYTVMFPTPVGINEGSNNIQFGIFPNPTTGIVTLYYSGIQQKSAVVKVENVIGQVLFQKNITNLEKGNSIELDLKGYAKGIYLIQLEAGNGKVTKKVVLQ